MCGNDKSSLTKRQHQPNKVFVSVLDESNDGKNSFEWKILFFLAIFPIRYTSAGISF